MLSITLFGSPQLTHDGRAVKLTRRKSRALVYYLAAHAQPLTRDHLLAFFWPDTPRASAQQVLRTMLHGLRKTLGSALIVEEDSLSLSAKTHVDVREFEQALNRTRHSEPRSGEESLSRNAETLRSAQGDRLASNLRHLTSVLDLYTGEFLADVSLPDTPAFDDWVMVQREHYRRLAVRGLTALSRLHEDSGDYASALASLDRALAFDALQEDLQREAIRLMYLSGDRPAAIRRYDQLRKLLDAELGMPPMAETRKLYDDIIADALKAKTADRRPPTAAPPLPASNFHAPRPISATLPFAGRAAEMQTLRDAASRPNRPLVLIEGEAGIGKTRLADEFIHERNILALVSAARELEQSLPYQPIIEALRGLALRSDWPALHASLQSSVPTVWLAEVARLLPELGTRPATTVDESRLWEGLHQFLTTLAARRPAIVFLDDLHWADASTLALLGYLVRRGQMTSAPVFFLAATRPAAARSALGTLLQSLTREGLVERLPLARLDAHDVSTFAQNLSTQYAHPLADWLMRNSEGNPYMLAELVRHARETHLIDPNGVLDLTMLASSPIVPQTVYSLIQSRLVKLSDPARHVLDAAVAVGREFDLDVVVRAAGLSENAALDALDELRVAGLILPSSGTRYTFDHTLTMEVAYREAGEPRHRLLHRRVAEALEATQREQLDSAAGLIAWHFVEGNAPDRAAPYSFRAGEQAAKLAAWREAIAFFEQALGASDKAERYKILMALGRAHLSAGEVAHATEVFREALTLAQSRGDADQTEATRMALAESLLPQSRFAEAIALAQQVSESGNPQNKLAAELIWGTALSLEGADLSEAVEHLRKAESFCAAQANPAKLAHIKFELGSVAAQQGALEQAIALYREALDAASSTDAPEALNWRILAHNNLAYHLHLIGDASAENYARAGLALVQEKGVLNLQTYLLSTLGEIALVAGDVDTANKYFADGLALAERLVMPERIVGLTANLGRVAARRGETASAIHRLSTALARADMLGTQHLAAQIRVWLAPLLPPTEARARLAEARAIAERGNRQRLLEEIKRVEKELH